MAPRPQRCAFCKRPETELTSCSAYDFKPRAFYAKSLTLAFFECVDMGTKAIPFSFSMTSAPYRIR